MKKIVSILLVLVTVLSMGTMAFADGTTTLTTTVPAATYTLNIPADQTIDYGKTTINLENAYITDGKNFAVGKNVSVTISYTPFSCEDNECTIPYTMKLEGPETSTTRSIEASGTAIIYKGRSSGGVYKFPMVELTNSYELSKLTITVLSSDWGKALAGEYTSVITFTSEVVAE